MYSKILTPLNQQTTYYVRAFATNEIGTSYGAELGFTTSQTSGFVTDIDGNVYKTVVIGTQEWMAENLRVTRFNNGDSIEYVENGSNWPQGELSPNFSPKYCFTQYPVEDRIKMGNLYNYFVVASSKLVCPVGWRVPNTSEWELLFSNPAIKFDMMPTLAPGSIPEKNGYWLEPLSGVTNSTGLTILPTGVRLLDGTYDGKGRKTRFWCKNLDDYDLAHFTATGFPITMGPGGIVKYIFEGFIWRAQDRRSGYSIRCIKE
jgi:uncharacterized protein (TIGR02145 family)